ncbi:MAG: lipocalin family protein [Bacteroidia bacterium]
MKRNRTSTISLASLATAAILFNLQACKKYEDGPGFTLRTPEGRLEGEWELTKVDSNSLLGFFDGVVVEFEKDGDLDITLTYLYTYYGYSIPYSYTYSGDWEFEDDKETLVLEIEGEEMEWEILKLTKDELWVESLDYGRISEYEFEKQ